MVTCGEDTLIPFSARAAMMSLGLAFLPSSLAMSRIDWALVVPFEADRFLALRLLGAAFLATAFLATDFLGDAGLLAARFLVAIFFLAADFFATGFVATNFLLFGFFVDGLTGAGAGACRVVVSVAIVACLTMLKRGGQLKSAPLRVLQSILA